MHYTNLEWVFFLYLQRRTCMLANFISIKWQRIQCCLKCQLGHVVFYICFMLACVLHLMEFGRKQHKLKYENILIFHTKYFPPHQGFILHDQYSGMLHHKNYTSARTQTYLHMFLVVQDLMFNLQTRAVTPGRRWHDHVTRLAKLLGQIHCIYCTSQCHIMAKLVVTDKCNTYLTGRYPWNGNNKWRYNKQQNNVWWEY
jgi:hypothetical protein